MGVKIITDSAVDLPNEIVKEYDIEVLPLLVLHGETEYEDGVSINAYDLYMNMRNEKVYKTAQISPGTFVEVFKKYAKENQECIYIAFSSGLSGTYESSLMARENLLIEFPEFQLDIIDSKCASLGFGLVVLKAAKLAREGCPRGEIVETVKFYAKHMEHIFTVDQLEYLWRGGRVSRSKAFIGDLLNVKPILDVEDGKLIPIDKARGTKRLFKRMMEIVEERGVDLAEQTIGISHGDNLEAVEIVKQMMQEKFGCQNFVISLIGSAIGAHSGPGTLAIFFLNKKPML
jgi:DegV family protein with EDD domain